MAFMINIARLRQMIGISQEEIDVITSEREFLRAQKQRFHQQVTSWLEQSSLVYQHDQSLLTDTFFDSITSGDYGHEFYISQYHQAMVWRHLKLSQPASLLLMNKIRKQLIAFAEEQHSHPMAKALCHVIDMSQTIVASVYQISDEVERFKQKFDHEVNRIQRSFSLIDTPPPSAILQAYKDHQQWKFLAYSIALGETVEATNLTLSHTQCRLAQWLQKSGEHLINAKIKDSFHQAHKDIHALGQQAIEFAQLNQPERAIELLNDIEKASDTVCEVLLNLIENEFIRCATNDALTGLPNKRSFDNDFAKTIAVATRKKLWVGLILIDIDFFKEVNDQRGHLAGDEALKEVAQILDNTMRLEDHAYRWGGEEFAAVTLNESEASALRLAERIRTTIAANTFCTKQNDALKLTVSCGVCYFQPPINVALHELFARVDEQLYLAKRNGRNRIEAVRI